MPDRKTLVSGLAAAIVLIAIGIVLGQLPSLYRDLVFLHRARVTQETMEAVQKAQQSNVVQSSPGHVEPAPVTPPATGK